MRRLQSSLTRSPQLKSTSTIARLRWPSAVLTSMAASMRSISSTLSTSGRCCGSEGNSKRAIGSAAMRSVM